MRDHQWCKGTALMLGLVVVLVLVGGCDQPGGSSTRVDTSHPRGIWMAADGTLWAATQYTAFQADATGSKLDGGRQFDISAVGRMEGIWGYGDTLYVLDSGNDDILRFRISDGKQLDSFDFSDEDFTIPGGISGDANTIWISNSGDNDGPEQLFAFRRSNGSRVSSRDVTKSTLRSAGCTDPEALHANDSTIFVHCANQATIYAFTKAKPHSRLRALEQATTRYITDLDGDAAGTKLLVSEGDRLRTIDLQ